MWDMESGVLDKGQLISQITLQINMRTQVCSFRRKMSSSTKVNYGYGISQTKAMALSLSYHPLTTGFSVSNEKRLFDGF